MFSYFTTLIAIGFDNVAVSIGNIVQSTPDTAQLVVAATLILGVASALAGILYSRTLR
jgi:hypothetical protein